MSDRLPWFENAIQRILGKSTLPGMDSRVLGLEELGRGAFGFVLRGYTHLWDRRAPERVRWLVIKAPLPVEVGDMKYALDNELLEVESEIREAIGAIPSLGVVPIKITIERDLLLEHIEPFWRSRIDLPSSIAVLCFPRPDERLAHIPPVTLYKLAQQPISTARDLVNWCEIARSLATAVVGMHSRGWVHRDLKLENVVAQEDGGFYRSVELIDFGAADRQSQSLSPLVGTMHYWRPERIESLVKSQRPSIVPFMREGQHGLGPSPSPFPSQDEDLYALGAILGRVLLGRAGPAARLYAPWIGEQASFAMREALDLEARVEDVVRRPEQLDEWLRDEIVEAFGLSHDLLKTIHTDSTASAIKLLRRVELLRVRALEALEDGPRGEARRDLQILAGLLDALEACASPEDERRWCDRYTARSVSLTQGPEPLDLDACVDLVSRGYATIAADALDRLLTKPSGDVARDARGLAMYVGVLLLRSDELDRARAVLDRFSDEARGAALHVAPNMTEGAADDAAAFELRWWREMLRARIDHQQGLDVSARLDALRLPDPSPQQHTWILALDLLVALRRGGRIRPDLMLKGQRLSRRTLETPELLFATLQLARCHAAQGEIVNALRWVHSGIAEAAVRGCPVEYAHLLMAAAHFVRRASQAADTQRRLQRQGVPLDTILEKAERLAIHAAEIFTRIELAGPRDRALGTAGECAMLRGSFLGIAEAATWFELARANAALSGTGEAPLAARRLGELREAWRSAPPDPGTSRARLYADRYGWILEKLLGSGGPAVELLEDEMPAEGVALDMLLASPPLSRAPSRVLVLGCGVGGDVFRLAEMFPEARVMGVDGSSWNIEAAERERARRGLDARRCALKCADLAERDALASEEGPRDKGLWDLVVMRDVLAHMAFKRSFLRDLRRRMGPLAELRLTVPVQKRPSEPGAWRKLLHSVWLTSLQAPPSLMEDLAWAGFEVKHGPVDRAADLCAFVRSRLDWFRTSPDEDAEEMRASPLLASRIEMTMSALIGASAPDGPLGWVSLSAVAL